MAQIKIEQNLHGIWVEMLKVSTTFDPKGEGVELQEFIKQFGQSSFTTLVYEDDNGNNVAICFDGTAGPLRASFV